jgi:nucleoside-diphosphate-sugar epimerase
VTGKSSASGWQGRLVLVVAASTCHVVLGAAGGTGSAVVRELVARGLRVRAVTRRGTGDVPEGVEQVAADVGAARGARQACEDAAVVYHCAPPDYRKWPELFPRMTEAVIDGAAEAGANDRRPLVVPRSSRTRVALQSLQESGHDR